jgi:hypothetical protein
MTKLPQMDTPEPPEPMAPPPPLAPPPAKPSKLRTYISLGVLVVVFAGIFYVIRNNTNADDLKVGACFDRPPSGQDFSTVEQHPCTEAHDAEVIFVAEYTGSTTLPSASDFETYTSDNCVPAAEAYLGKTAENITDMGLGYITPNQSGWDGGDRTILCYVYNSDHSKLTTSVKAGS